MTTRTTRKTVTIARPFCFSGMDGTQPPGTYTVETDEELIEELSFPVYRRTATVMLLPSPSGGAGSGQVVNIDPLELEAALEQTP